MQTEKPLFIKRFGICVLCVYLSVLGSAVMERLYLPQAQSRVIGETANLIFQSLTWKDTTPSPVLVVETDRAFTSQVNSYYDIERSWPPTYGAWESLVRYTVNTLRPRAVFLDVYFQSIRGKRCGPDQVYCDREGWLDFLQTLCEIGGAECVTLESVGSECKSTELRRGSIPVLIGSFENGPIDPQSVSVKQSLDRLVASCAHLEYTPLSAPTRYSSKDSYGIEGLSFDGARALKPAMAMIEASCRMDTSPFSPAECEDYSTEFKTLAENDAGYGVFWKSELEAVPDAPRPDAGGQVASNDLACTTVTNRLPPLSETPAVCGTQPSMQASAVRDFATNALKGETFPEAILDRYVLIGADRQGMQDIYISPLSQRISAGVFQHATVLEMLLTKGTSSPTTIPLFFGNAAPFAFKYLVFPIISIAILLAATTTMQAFEHRFVQGQKVPSPLAVFVGRLVKGAVLSVIIAAVFWLVLDTLLRWSFHEWAATSFFSTALFAIATLGDPE